MYSAKELIQILLLKNGLSMRKLVQKMNEEGYEPMTIGGLSKMLITDSIKFRRVQEILSFLGYGLKIVRLKPKNSKTPRALEEIEENEFLDI